MGSSVEATRLDHENGRSRPFFETCTHMSEGKRPDGSSDYPKVRKVSSVFCILTPGNLGHQPFFYHESIMPVCTSLQIESENVT